MKQLTILIIFITSCANAQLMNNNILLSNTPFKQFIFDPYFEYSTDTKIWVRSQVETDATVYGVVVTKGSGQPTKAQILAGENSSGGAAISSDNVNETGTGFALEFTGLSKGGEYDCYLYADASGTTTNIAHVDVETISTIDQLRNATYRRNGFSVLHAGGLVTSWPNALGFTEYDLAIRAGSSAPTYNATGGLNSQPEVEYNGTDMRMRSSTSNFFNSAYHVMVYKFDVNNVRQMLWSDRIEDSNTAVFGTNIELQSSGNFRITDIEGSPAVGQTRNIINPMTTANYHYQTLEYNGVTNGTSSLTLNFDNATLVNATNTGIRQFTVTSAPRQLVTGWIDGTVLGMDGKVVEDIMYLGRLTSDDKSAINNEIETLYPSLTTGGTTQSASPSTFMTIPPIDVNVSAINLSTVSDIVIEVDGQSNVGIAPLSEAPAYIVDGVAIPNCYIWYAGDVSWSALTPGVNGGPNAPASIDLYSIVHEIGYRLNLLYPTKNIRFVMNAVGGTPLNVSVSDPYWRADVANNLFDLSVTTTNAALASLTDYIFLARIWVQGESDCTSSGNANRYDFLEKNLVQSWNVNRRTMTLVSMVPEINPATFPFKSVVNAAKSANFSADRYDMLVDTSNDAIYQIGSDGLHYNGTGITNLANTFLLMLGY